MIPSIIVILNDKSTDSFELNFSAARLKRLLPESARWLTCRGGIDDEMLKTLSRDLPANAGILLFAHPHLVPTPGTIDLLSAALETGVDFADACDNLHPEPMHAPDYCTLRGMERYAVSASFRMSEVDVRSPFLIRLTTLEGWSKKNASGVRVQGAFVHDASEYHGSDRTEILPLLPKSTNRLLDVGGGEGRFLSAAKRLLGCETHLAEISHSAAVKSEADRIWQGDFLSMEIPFRFDVITFLDMLEHVENPEDYLRNAAGLLEPEGIIIASIPNVSHWSVIADLIEGRWDYTSSGIHCITHLRFFTRRTIEDLFSDAGLSILNIEPVKVPCPSDWKAHWAATPRLAVDSDSLDDYAYLVRASLP